MLAAFSSLAVSSPGEFGATGNMNGKYEVASGAKQGVKYNDDYASKGYEYFDVWAPEIATHYGEVFWTDQHDQPLPPAIVERFKGKVIALQGYEQDQVMVNPVGSPGKNPTEDVSVPINWAYNHHFMAWMTGADSEMKHVAADIQSDHVDTGLWDDETNNPANPMKWVTVDSPAAASRPEWMKAASIPTSQMFSEGNGGESRKSFHGYPDGYAQLLSSPTTWHITPMQIDTRNRDCGATAKDVGNCTKKGPNNAGPEPLQARYGRGMSAYPAASGVLECPCTSRYGGDWVFYGNDTKSKQIVHDIQALTANCGGGDDLTTAQMCFDAAHTAGVAATGSTQKNVTVSDASKPKGCSVLGAADGSATVTFNSIKAATGACGTSAVTTGSQTSQINVKFGLSLDSSKGGVNMTLSAKGKYCSANHDNVIKTFASTKSNDTAADTVAMKACSAFCLTSSTCNFCSVDHARSNINRWNAIPKCGDVNKWAGSIAGDIATKTRAGVATITLSGPADAWFGVGVDAKVMSDAPYVLLVNSTSVWEQQIGTCGSEAEHCAGAVLANSLTIVSNDVSNNVRTVVATRGFVGKTKLHYTFDPVNHASINFITAIGSSDVFAYHMMHAPATITVTSTTAASCLCDLGANGEMCEADGTKCASFVKSCQPGDATSGGSLLAQRNPTCNSRQYSGGLKCCSHGRIMLDVDQPVRPELLQYHMKYRFWFQEYVPVTTKKNASHVNLQRIYQQTEANAGEYDIPPAFPLKDGGIPGYPHLKKGELTPGTTCTGNCPDGDDCKCVHTIHYYWQVSNMELIYAGGHCHAPACIDMILYNNDTGKVICSQIPAYGAGNVTLAGDGKYDELGYIAIPPCLWGEEGELESSYVLPPGTTLHSVKRNVNTHVGHYGEMASWQMRGIVG